MCKNLQLEQLERVMISVLLLCRYYLTKTPNIFKCELNLFDTQETSFWGKTESEVVQTCYCHTA